MPIINIQWAEGRTTEQKREVAKRITDVISEVCHVDKSNIYILINDLPHTNVVNKGKLKSDGWD